MILGAQVAKVEALKLVTGYPDEGAILLPRLPDELLQVLFDGDAISRILIPQDEEPRVGLSPQPNFPHQLFFQILFALEGDENGLAVLRNEVRQNAPKHHLCRALLQKADQSAHRGSALPKSPCFQRYPIAVDRRASCRERV